MFVITARYLDDNNDIYNHYNVSYSFEDELSKKRLFALMEAAEKYNNLQDDYHCKVVSKIDETERSKQLEAVVLELKNLDKQFTHMRNYFVYYDREEVPLCS